MERRLQLLLDQHRYALVEREAHSSGRSVAAVIREAIDLRFADDDGARMAAASRLLETTASGRHDREPNYEPDYEPDWAETKAALEDEIASRSVAE